MKKLFNFIRIIYNDIRKGNRVTTFFFLLSLYYIINLLTSPITSGMSGGLEAEHNIFNQVTAGIFVLFVLFYSVVSKANHSYSLVKVMAVFLFYITFRTYMGFATDNSRHTIFSFSSIFNMCFWAGSLIFGLKCFRLVPPELLKRMVKMVLTAYLIYVTYRLFTQKALLMRLGISMGINMAASVYMIIPLIFLVFKGKLKTFLLLLCCFICLYSAKRQAVAGLAIVLIFSLKTIYELYFQKRKFLAFIMIVPLIIVSSNFVMRVSKDLLSRQELLEEKDDTDSGRLQLWAVAMSGFQNSDNATQWFGGGPGTGRKYIGAFFPIARAPHNGFIQVLCDYGYIGLIFYGLFFVILLGYVLKVRGVDNKLHYLSICASFIFANAISHPGNLALVFLAIGVGYIFYMQDNEKSKLLSGNTTAAS